MGLVKVVMGWYLQESMWCQGEEKNVSSNREATDLEGLTLAKTIRKTIPTQFTLG